MDLSKSIVITEMILMLFDRIEELHQLWKRAVAGEKISDEEILSHQAKVDAAVAAWDAQSR